MSSSLLPAAPEVRQLRGGTERARWKGEKLRDGESISGYLYSSRDKKGRGGKHVQRCLLQHTGAAMTLHFTF